MGETVQCRRRKMQRDTHVLAGDCRSWPKDRLDLPDTTKQSAQRMSEPRQCDVLPLKCAAKYLVGNPTAAIRFHGREHADQNHNLRGQRFRWRSLKKEYDWIGSTTWYAHFEIWIHTSELDSTVCVRRRVLRCGERKTRRTIPEVTYSW